MKILSDKAIHLYLIAITAFGSLPAMGAQEAEKAKEAAQELTKEEKAEKRKGLRKKWREAKEQYEKRKKQKAPSAELKKLEEVMKKARRNYILALVGIGVAAAATAAVIYYGPKELEKRKKEELVSFKQKFSQFVPSEPSEEIDAFMFAAWKSVRAVPKRVKDRTNDLINAGTRSHQAYTAGKDGRRGVTQ